jgi:hypothetical protein
MTVEFLPPLALEPEGVNHAQAAAGNVAVADEAIGALRDAVRGDADISRILLRAAAGAGKSYVLRKLVAEAVDMRDVSRVAVVAFQNRQIHPLALELTKLLGRDAVCLFLSESRLADLPAEVANGVTIALRPGDIPSSAKVIISTAHKLAAHPVKAMTDALGAGLNGNSAFDVLFVDEAWQLAQHVFTRINRQAPIWVGVGDVGQLPPIEVGENPWRGDPGYNPYRAWPTLYENGGDSTWIRELPTVWRPTAEQLGLWRAFYPDWEELNCVASAGDRKIELGQMSAVAKSVWEQVATGVPTLLEIDGLPDPDAPDVDLPLTRAIESLLNELFGAGFTLRSAILDDDGVPTGEFAERKIGDADSDPLVSVLATRNQAVDDAADAVDRLRAKHKLETSDLLASTVDSWQGQTNGITVGIHPLSGAVELDEFNSAFGRLAVTCTRATHGMLMVARPGLDELLRSAPARPGTPMGEPGFRTLPRQTHQRILASYARGTLNWNDVSTERE